MITLNVVCIGNLKENYLKQAQDEYVKRLGKFCKINIIELGEAKLLGNQQSSVNLVIEKESIAILQHLNGFTILLDVEGNSLTSVELAKKINQIAQTNSIITIIIGGSYGVSQTLKQKVNYRLSFSKFTFPHQLVRIMMLEQFYRAFTINNNITYHK